MLVETVGVGQSETVVADMVDSSWSPMLAGAGDELQGIKKGALELADLAAVNKADGDNRPRRVGCRGPPPLLHLMSPASPTWSPPVVPRSGLTGDGLDAWQGGDPPGQDVGPPASPGASTDQQVRWMWAMLDDRLRDDPGPIQPWGGSRRRRQRVHDGEIPGTVAVDEVAARPLLTACQE